MNKNDSNYDNKPHIIIMLFDSGKINASFYGEKIFEKFIEGEEISQNPYKVIFSVGDLFDSNIYDDITPFLINDNLCTITPANLHIHGYMYAILLEDITRKYAKIIDKRLKGDFSAYIGMTSVDINSSDDRKQFWKSLIRSFSIEYKTITAFGSIEEYYFHYSEVAEKHKFIINYDHFPDIEDDKNKFLFSTRQSSFINSVKQLEFHKSHNDSDRGLSEMNYSLVREVGLAGTQIWKAIDDINKTTIPKEPPYYINTDYIFMSLYNAAQGVERLLKVSIELIMYGNTNDNEKQKSENILYSHNHLALINFIEKKEKIVLNKNSKKLLHILMDFYNKARYNRYKYSQNNTLELELFQSFGDKISQRNFDNAIKHLYGKALGDIAQTLYKLINDLSDRLNIYVYELDYNSVAHFSLSNYNGNDLYEKLKKHEQAKKELFWYLIKSGNELPIAKMASDIIPLPFDKSDLQEYINQIIYNNDGCGQLYDFVSEEYSQLINDNKVEWKNRIEAIDLLIGNNLYFDDEDDD